MSALEFTRMKDELLIVYKSILPDYFESVLKAKSLVEDSKMSVCEACKEVDISRSTFYKYKDKIFRATEQYGKKSIITVKTADKKGVLGAILDIVYDFGANVIAINQAMSVRGVGFITLTVDVTDVAIDVSDLVQAIRNTENVKNASIMAIE